MEFRCGPDEPAETNGPNNTGSPRNATSQGFVNEPNTNPGAFHNSYIMSKKAADSHKQAASHHTEAAKHHTEAAKHQEAGNHEKAAHHAHTAAAHTQDAKKHSNSARKSHSEEHGKK